MQKVSTLLKPYTDRRPWLAPGHLAMAISPEMIGDFGFWVSSTACNPTSIGFRSRDTCFVNRGLSPFIRGIAKK